MIFTFQEVFINVGFRQQQDPLNPCHCFSPVDWEEEGMHLLHGFHSKAMHLLLLLKWKFVVAIEDSQLLLIQLTKQKGK